MGDHEDARVQVTVAELERLQRIEAAARHVFSEWPGKRSATPLLSAMAELRAALAEEPADSSA